MIRLAVSRPVSTLVAAFSLAALGSLSLARLPVALLPQLERPRLVLTAKADGQSRDAMLRGVTEPLERALQDLPGVVSSGSETRDGQSRVIVEADWQADAERLHLEAERLAGGASSIALDSLDVQLAAGDASPITEAAVTGGGSAAERTSFARSVLVPELARLAGAGRVDVVGASPARVVVRPRPADLAAHGLTSGDIAERLEVVGMPVPAGRLRDGALVRPLVLHEHVSSLEALRAVRIARGARDAVPLGEVATCAIEEVPDGTVYRLAGADGVLVRVFRAPGANAVKLAAAVRERVDVLSARAHGITLTVTSDRSAEVVAALRGLVMSAFLGILLGTLALRFVLGRWTPTLALSLVIPLALLMAFSAFDLFGIGLDVVSLAGLALAAGMLVDNSIVVLEAIETARESNVPEPVVAGPTQVGMAVIASTLTTVVVFVPLLYVQGLARAFFGEQAFAFVAAITASLLLSFTLTPVLAGRHGKLGRGRSPGQEQVLALLAAARRHRAFSLGVVSLLSLVALVAAAHLRREILPEETSHHARIELRLPPDLEPHEAARRIESLEHALLDGAEGARSLGFTLGASASALLSGELERSMARLDVECEDEQGALAFRAHAESVLALLPDVEGRVIARPSAFAEVLHRNTQDMEILVSAPDEAGARSLAARLEDSLARIPGLRTTHDDLEVQRPMVGLRWDDGRLAKLRITRSDVESQVRSALEPRSRGRVEVPGVEPEILLAPVDAGDFALIPVRLPTESDEPPRVVPLTALSTPTPAARSSLLLRDRGRSAVRILVPAAAGTDAIMLGKALAAEPLGPGESARLSGAALELRRSFAELELALALSLVLAFLALAALYESILLPLIVMTTVPVAATGGLGLLALTGQSLNVLSFLGLIMLGGIVVSHSVVLVDRIEQLRIAGEAEADAVLRATRERYRPILMTTVTTLFGMLPLALMPGEGASPSRSLATAVLGGLVTSTLASLVVVPMLHEWIERHRRRRGKTT